MDSNGILITGSTGTLGSEIIRSLISRDVCIRIASRDVKRTRELIETTCEVVYLDFEKPETYDNALRGITSLFLATPVTYPRLDDLLMPFVMRARELGVRHIVALGSTGISIESDSPTMVIEKCIQNCGIHYTLMRPNIFMQNLSRIIGPSVKKHNQIIVPASSARISFVDERDVAQAVVIALLDDSYAGKIHSLTGPEALSLYEIATVLSDLTGRDIKYTPVSHSQFWNDLIEMGWDVESAEFVVGLFEIARHGWCAAIKPDLDTILCKPSRTFYAFARDFKEAWRPQG